MLKFLVYVAGEAEKFISGKEGEKEEKGK